MKRVIKKNVNFKILFQPKVLNIPFLHSGTLAHLFYRSVHSTVPRNGAVCLDKAVVSLPHTNPDTLLPTRFNWRLRAPSRVKKDEKKENSSYLKRLRPADTGSDVGKPFYSAIKPYSVKYVAFLCILDHSLSTCPFH